MADLLSGTAGKRIRNHKHTEHLLDRIHLGLGFVIEYRFTYPDDIFEPVICRQTEPVRFSYRDQRNASGGVDPGSDLDSF